MIKKVMFTTSGKNDNCMAGVICPNCGNEDKIVVETRAVMVLQNDGLSREDDILKRYEPGVDWDVDAFTRCPICDFSGEHCLFKIDSDPILAFVAKTDKGTYKVFNTFKGGDPDSSMSTMTFSFDRDDIDRDFPYNENAHFDVDGLSTFNNNHPPFINEDPSRENHEAWGKYNNGGRIAELKLAVEQAINIGELMVPEDDGE